MVAGCSNDEDVCMTRAPNGRVATTLRDVGAERERSAVTTDNVQTGALTLRTERNENMSRDSLVHIATSTADDRSGIVVIDGDERYAPITARRTYTFGRDIFVIDTRTHDDGGKVYIARVVYLNRENGATFGDIGTSFTTLRDARNRIREWNKQRDAYRARSTK